LPAHCFLCSIEYGKTELEHCVPEGDCSGVHSSAFQIFLSILSSACLVIISKFQTSDSLAAQGGIRRRF
jgi:hypothetical protein